MSQLDLGGVLEGIVERVGATGAQWYASVAGRVRSHGAIGESPPGTAVTERTLHKIWCAMKPVSAIAAIAAFDEAGVGLETQIGALLADCDLQPEVAAVTIRDVLDHRACLIGPNIADVLQLGLKERDTMLKGVVSATASHAAAYNDHVSWVLLAAAVGEVQRRSPDIYLRDFARDEVRVRDLHVSMSPSEFLEAHGRIGASVSATVNGPLPWLMDRTLEFASRQAGFVMGGYATMRALGRWYEWLLERDDLLDRVEQLRRGAVFDATLGRECEFSAGLMVDLGRHGYGQAIGTRAIGHTGWLGTCFGFADPSCDLVVCVLVNALTHPDQAERWRAECTTAAYDLVDFPLDTSR